MTSPAGNETNRNVKTMGKNIIIFCCIGSPMEGVILCCRNMVMPMRPTLANSWLVRLTYCWASTPSCEHCAPVVPLHWFDSDQAYDMEMTAGRAAASVVFCRSWQRAYIQLFWFHCTPRRQGAKRKHKK